MNDRIQPVSDAELHAYVDGELSRQRHIEVESWLASHPQAAKQVEGYRAINARLHAQFDPVLNEPFDLPESTERPRFAAPLRAAVLAGAMLLSGVIGWQFERIQAAPEPQLALSNLVQPAAFAHLVYANDAHRPVEIPAIQRATLNNWVSERLHRPLQAPDLSDEGFEFVGGRLLPSTNRMAAQFMYQDTQGQRLTVYARRMANNGGLREFQYEEQDGLHIFYWLDDAMGYAVTGSQDASNLIQVANAVHAALRPPTDASAAEAADSSNESVRL